QARPIRRGKLRKPTEFGYKVAIGESAEGFVVSHQTYEGNPPDAETIEDIVHGARASGMKVKSGYGDRAYGDSVGDEAFARCGIEDVVVPRKGKPDPREQSRNWRRRYRFRAG